MRIRELFEVEDLSTYAENVKSTIMDYLVSIAATGTRSPLSTVKFVKYLKQRENIDITPQQLVELLSDSDFDVTTSQIDLSGKPQGGEVDVPGSEPEPDLAKQKVKNMARQQVSKEM